MANKAKSNPVPDRDLRAALLEAERAADVLPALARVEYRRAHPGADFKGDGPDVAAFLRVYSPVLTEASMPAWDRGAAWFNETHADCVAAVGFEAWTAHRDEAIAYRDSLRERLGFGPNDVLETPPAMFEEVCAHDLEAHHRLFVAAVAAKPDEGIRHPLAEWIRQWLKQRPSAPYVPKVRASLARLHRITERLPGFPSHLAAPVTGTGQGYLPGIGAVVAGCPSWLLWLFDAAGGESMAQGRGAPWPMRLFVGALLHLAIAERDGEWHTLRFPVFDVQDDAGRVTVPGVTSWLHPGGWQNRRRDWLRFPAALDAMRAKLAYVPVPGLGDVAMMIPSVIPRAASDPIVEFTIRVPKSAKHGARLNWPRLCAYGTESAALYRAYLSVSAFLDNSASRGHPQTRLIRPALEDAAGNPRRGKGGRIIRAGELVENETAPRYSPFLTDSDLARMIGFDGNNRFRRRDARKAFERLDDDGVVDLVPERDGFRLYGPRASSPVKGR